MDILPRRWKDKPNRQDQVDEGSIVYAHVLFTVTKRLRSTTTVDDQGMQMDSACFALTVEEFTRSRTADGETLIGMQCQTANPITDGVDWRQANRGGKAGVSSAVTVGISTVRENKGNRKKKRKEKKPTRPNNNHRQINNNLPALPHSKPLVPSHLSTVTIKSASLPLTAQMFCGSRACNPGPSFDSVSGPDWRRKLTLMRCAKGGKSR